MWTCDATLAIVKGQLPMLKGQSAPSRPFSMGMPIASGWLPVMRLADVWINGLINLSFLLCCPFSNWQAERGWMHSMERLGDSGHTKRTSCLEGSKENTGFAKSFVSLVNVCNDTGLHSSVASRNFFFLVFHDNINQHVLPVYLVMHLSKSLTASSLVMEGMGSKSTRHRCNAPNWAWNRASSHGTHSFGIHSRKWRSLAAQDQLLLALSIEKFDDFWEDAKHKMQDLVVRWLNKQLLNHLHHKVEKTKNASKQHNRMFKIT